MQHELHYASFFIVRSSRACVWYAGMSRCLLLPQHETAERLEVLRRADEYEKALGVKDHMLWTILQVNIYSSHAYHDVVVCGLVACERRHITSRPLG